jgi:preprotein translocase subunit SecB
MQPNSSQKDFQMAFESFRIVNLSFAINSNFEQDKAINMNPEIAVANMYDKQNKTLNIRVKVSLSEGNMPFSFDVVGEGRFVFKMKPDEQTLARVEKINGPAIIYPYVRETIADLTRRAGYPPLHLPPVNFVRLAAEEKQPALKKKGRLKQKG